MCECPVCGRPKVESGKYCEYHSRAMDNLKSAFEHWKQALGIRWEDYLKRVQALDETGRWVKELIEYLIAEADS